MRWMPFHVAAAFGAASADRRIRPHNADPTDAAVAARTVRLDIIRLFIVFPPAPFTLPPPPVS
jgi:hypothetical protein